MSDCTPEAWQRTIAEIKNLSATPVVLAALMHTLSDPRSSAKDVAEIIAADPGLTTKLLRVANSAYYGAKGEVSTPSRAVALIGYSEVRAVCCVMAVAAMLPSGKPLPHFDRGEFWKHSLAAGLAARLLAERAGITDPELAFVSGLLHDMGKLVFQQHANAQFSRALTEAHERHLELRKAEGIHLGVDHARLGRWIAQHWQLPAPIACAIGRHHDPLPGAQEFPATAVAHAGNVVALVCGHGSSGEPSVPTMDDAVRQALRLHNKDQGFLQQELSAQMARSEELVRVLVEAGGRGTTLGLAAA